MSRATLSVGAGIGLSDETALPTRRIYQGRFVDLELLDPHAHTADLYEASHNCPEAKTIWDYLPVSGPFDDVGSMESWLHYCRIAPDTRFYSVRHLETGRFIGMASFASIEPDMRRLALAHLWYAPHYQKTRINTECVYLLLRDAFERLAYRRVEWNCDSQNKAARKAALRLGFSFEGVFRKHMIVNGRNRDTAGFSMTDDDWRILKPNFEQWLYDNDGGLSLAQMNSSMMFSSMAMF